MDIVVYSVKPLSISPVTVRDGTYFSSYLEPIVATEAGFSSFSFSVSVGECAAKRNNRP